MTGVTWPSSMSSASTSRSAAFSETMTETSRCGTNRERNGRPQAAVESSQPPAAGLAADDHEAALRIQGPAKLPKRGVAAEVQDDLVAARSICEVVLGVVDHVVGADRPDEVHLRRTAQAGDLGFERLGDLHGVASNAAGRAGDHDLLSGFDATELNGLHGGGGGYGHGRCLHGGRISPVAGKLRRLGARVSGEGALGDAEHLVAYLECGHVLADRLDAARDLPAPDARLGARTP